MFSRCTPSEIGGAVLLRRFRLFRNRTQRINSKETTKYLPDGKMSLWAKVVQLPQPIMKKIRDIYGSNFPIEVRHYLADWIEDRLLNEPVCENDQDAANFLNQLLMELERTAINLPESNLTIKTRLNQAASIFRQLFSHNPYQLYQNVMNCLYYERQCVACPDECVNVQDECVNVQDECVNVQDQEGMEVFDSVHLLQTMVRTNENDNRNLMKEYKHLLLEVDELQTNWADLETIEDVEMWAQANSQYAQHEELVNDQLRLYASKRQALIDGFRQLILITAEVQSKVLEYLSRWKFTQCFPGNSGTTMCAINLDTIQTWCESLADIIWSTKDQIWQAMQNNSKQHVKLEEVPDLLAQAMVDVTDLLKTLITNTFIVEQQPPQVIKSDVRFTATVRLLVSNLLQLETESPQVNVSVISDSEVQQIQKTNKASEQPCGEIANNIGYLRYDETAKQLSAYFPKMRVKNIKRKYRKATDCVMDEKYALLFQSSFALGHGNLVFSVWTISVPVVVIVHGKQESHACATIIWDNAFAAIDRIPFQVPDVVSWYHLADVLNVKFRDSIGCSLTAEHMHFLCEKAFNTNQPFPVPADLTITWSQFSKLSIPNRSFSFWDWFYAAMKLTRDHLHGPWLDGSIIGFIHKSKAEEHLLNCPRGTFLLRFSDSVLGSVSIAWVGEDNDGQPSILHIQPFTASDLSRRSLADRIRDLGELFYLYPNKPKHEAFEQYMTPAKSPRNEDYIAWELRTVLTSGSNNDELCGNTTFNNNHLPVPQFTKCHTANCMPGMRYLCGCCSSPFSTCTHKSGKKICTET